MIKSSGLTEDYLENGSKSDNPKVLSLKSQKECLTLLVHRCSAVLHLVSLAKSFYSIGSQLILKNA